MSATSVPERASVTPAPAKISPRASGARYRCRCSSVPKRWIELPTNPLGNVSAHATTWQTLEISSMTIA